MYAELASKIYKKPTHTHFLIIISALAPTKKIIPFLLAKYIWIWLINAIRNLKNSKDYQ